MDGGKAITNFLKNTGKFTGRQISRFGKALKKSREDSIKRAKAPAAAKDAAEKPAEQPSASDELSMPPEEELEPGGAYGPLEIAPREFTPEEGADLDRRIRAALAGGNETPSSDVDSGTDNYDDELTRAMGLGDEEKETTLRNPGNTASPSSGNLGKQVGDAVGGVLAGLGVGSREIIDGIGNMIKTGRGQRDTPTRANDEDIMKALEALSKQEKIGTIAIQKAINDITGQYPGSNTAVRMKDKMKKLGLIDSAGKPNREKITKLTSEVPQLNKPTQQQGARLQNRDTIDSPAPFSPELSPADDQATQAAIDISQGGSTQGAPLKNRSTLRGHPGVAAGSTQGAPLKNRSTLRGHPGVAAAGATDGSTIIEPDIELDDDDIDSSEPIKKPKTPRTTPPPLPSSEPASPTEPASSEDEEEQVPKPELGRLSRRKMDGKQSKAVGTSYRPKATVGKLTQEQKMFDRLSKLAGLK